MNEDHKSQGKKINWKKIIKNSVPVFQTHYRYGIKILPCTITMNIIFSKSFLPDTLYSSASFETKQVFLSLLLLSKTLGWKWIVRGGYFKKLITVTGTTQRLFYILSKFFLYMRNNIFLFQFFHTSSIWPLLENFEIKITGQKLITVTSHYRYDLLAYITI